LDQIRRNMILDALLDEAWMLCEILPNLTKYGSLIFY